MHIASHPSTARLPTPPASSSTVDSGSTDNTKISSGKAVSEASNEKPGSENLAQRLRQLDGKRAFQKKGAVESLEQTLAVLKAEIGRGHRDFETLAAVGKLDDMVKEAKRGGALKSSDVKRELDTVVKARNKVVAERAGRSGISFFQVAMLKAELSAAKAAASESQTPLADATKKLCSAIRPEWRDGNISINAARAQRYVNSLIKLDPAMNGLDDAFTYKRFAFEGEARPGTKFDSHVEALFAATRAGDWARIMAHADTETVNAVLLAHAKTYPSIGCHIQLNEETASILANLGPKISRTFEELQKGIVTSAEKGSLTAFTGVLNEVEAWTEFLDQLVFGARILTDEVFLGKLPIEQQEIFRELGEEYLNLAHVLLDQNGLVGSFILACATMPRTEEAMNALAVEIANPKAAAGRSIQPTAEELDQTQPQPQAAPLSSPIEAEWTEPFKKPAAWQQPVPVPGLLETMEEERNKLKHDAAALAERPEPGGAPAPSPNANNDASITAAVPTMSPTVPTEASASAPLAFKQGSRRFSAAVSQSNLPSTAPRAASRDERLKAEYKDKPISQWPSEKEEFRLVFFAVYGWIPPNMGPADLRRIADVWKTDPVAAPTRPDSWQYPDAIRAHVGLPAAGSVIPSDEIDDASVSMTDSDVPPAAPVLVAASPPFLAPTNNQSPGRPPTRATVQMPRSVSAPPAEMPPALPGTVGSVVSPVSALPPSGIPVPPPRPPAGNKPVAATSGSLPRNKPLPPVPSKAVVPPTPAAPVDPLNPPPPSYDPPILSPSDRARSIAALTQQAANSAQPSPGKPSTVPLSEVPSVKPLSTPKKLDGAPTSPTKAPDRPATQVNLEAEEPRFTPQQLQAWSNVPPPMDVPQAPIISVSSSSPNPAAQTPPLTPLQQAAQAKPQAGDSTSVDSGKPVVAAVVPNIPVPPPQPQPGWRKAN